LYRINKLINNGSRMFCLNKIKNADISKKNVFYKRGRKSEVFNVKVICIESTGF